MKEIFASNYISKSVSRIDTSEVRKLFDLVGKIENPINLSIGQPDFPVPEAVKEAYIKAIREDKNAYTASQGILPLRERISSKWQIENKIQISAENIIVSTGVASLLYLLFEAMFDEQDEILLIDPYFLLYESLAKLRNLKVSYISENFDREQLNKLDETGCKPKAIIFANPSNPTGKILSKEQLTNLSEYAQKHDSILVSDEIYEAFDYDSKFISMATINPHRTVTLGGFSKSHAMTGLRVGYLGVPEPLKPLLEKITALQQYSIVCSPQPAQWAALQALDTDITSELALMKERRDLVVKLLSDKVQYTTPEGAFYVFPEVPTGSVHFVEQSIKERLLVVPGYIFSQNDNAVRISYAQPSEIIEEGLHIFLKMVERLS